MATLTKLALGLVALSTSCVPVGVAKTAAGADKLRTRDGICTELWLRPSEFNVVPPRAEICLRRGSLRTLHDDPSRNLMLLTVFSHTIDESQPGNYQAKISHNGTERLTIMVPNGEVPTARITSTKYGAETNWTGYSALRVPFDWQDGRWTIDLVYRYDTNHRGTATIDIGVLPAAVQLAEQPTASTTQVLPAKSPPPVADCATTSECLSNGLCTPRNGKCTAATDGDCKRSQACKMQRKCTALAGECVR